jgi:tetratricopeptide (TPR) repeat protein
MSAQLPPDYDRDHPRWRGALLMWSNRVARAVALFGGLWLLRSILGMRWVVFPASGRGLALFVSVGLNLVLGVELALYMRPRTAPSRSFEQALIQRVAEMHERGDYAAIVRYHAAFSRMLWFVGAVRELRQLGRLSEDAAARFGDQRTQAAALIDDLGWCMVVLGEYPEAERNIRHGLQLAERAGDAYLQARAHRHLAGLATKRRPWDLVTSDAELVVAERVARQIPDETPRREMLAGIRFAVAVLRFFQGRLDEALELVSDPAETADPGHDVHCHALRGRIHEARGDYQLAKDQYRRGYEQAKQVKRRDEEIRNLLGLARVARAEGRNDEAAPFQRRADELLRRTPIAYELTAEESEELRRSATGPAGQASCRSASE